MSSTGIPTITVAASVFNRHLRFTIANGMAGSAFTYTLDAELTQSSQQGSDTQATVVEILNGMAGDAAATLAETYNFGSAAVDQTMVLANVHNPTTVGVTIEGSTAAVTSDGVSLEIRQNAAWSIPTMIRRTGAIAAGPNLQFTKARGTFAAPAAVNAADELGTIDFYGYPVNAYTLDARIVGACVGASPNYGTSLSFYVTPRAGVLGLAMVLDGNGAAANTQLIFYNSPDVFPIVDHAGRLGLDANRWVQAYIDTVNAYVNVCLGGGAIAGAANHTVMLPNDGTQPGIQANQVYLGAADFAGLGGTNLACLEISSEEPAIIIGAQVVDRLIPIRFNGTPYYLHATDVTLI